MYERRFLRSDIIKHFLKEAASFKHPEFAWVSNEYKPGIMDKFMFQSLPSHIWAHYNCLSINIEGLLFMDVSQMLLPCVYEPFKGEVHRFYNLVSKEAFFRADSEYIWCLGSIFKF